MYSVEVCLSPKLFNDILTKENYILVVNDILRATTSICTAIDNGIKEIIPVPSIEIAKEYKEKGFIVASETDGIKDDFADMGNSALGFMNKNLEGKSIAYNTTNGTKTILLANDSAQTVIGSFANIDTLCSWLIKQNKNVVILCSAWKNKPCLEDSLFAGALAKQLLEKGFTSICDSVVISTSLWDSALNNLEEFVKDADNYKRLTSKGLNDVFKYTFTQNTTNTIPIVKNGKIVREE